MAPNSIVVETFMGRTRAEEYALVILAMGLPYWIVEEEGRFHLCVRAEDAERIVPELRQYSEERRALRKQRLQPPAEAISSSLLSLYVFAAVMMFFYLLQLAEGRDWLLKGRADAVAILAGEWHRTVTALTLHSDLGHLLANLGAGALFAAGLLPLMGVGWTWLGMVLGGGLGNALNAWGHRTEGHYSIGASTAVFAGLGILMAWQAMSALRSAPALLRRRAIFVPIGAGLALLAFLGTGGEGSRVDFMAHLLGMLSGGVIGALLHLSKLPQRTSPLGQLLLAALALLLLAASWLKA